MSFSPSTLSRRRAWQHLAAWAAASPLAAQLDLSYRGERLPALDELVNVFEFEPICKLRLPRENYDYIAGASDSEWSLRNNRQAFDKITFRPRRLVKTADLDLSLDLFGTRLTAPILIAPTAAHNLASPEGELATARAAAQVGTIHILSTDSSQPLEKVAAATTFPKWFQLYPGPDLEGTWERVARAKQAGFTVLVLTVDISYGPRRERELRNRARAQVPAAGNTRPGASAGNARKSAAELYGVSPKFINQLDWSFTGELKKRWGGPVVVKGILTGEDAALAAKHGMDGVIVSNHGARYLDYVPATIDILPEVVEAVGGRIPVLVDGGFRRGTDVLKALALGAKAVCVGRPPLWGLGAYGAAGCQRVLEMLRTELALAMGHCGRATLKEIDRGAIRL